MEAKIKNKLEELGFSEYKLYVKKGEWYNEISLNISYALIEITELKSGCGAMLFSGYGTWEYNRQNRNHLIKLVHYLFSLYKGDCDVFITTVGTHRKYDLKILEELEFNQLLEYPNARHTNRSNQALMVKHLN